jgi:hypothetical protein
MTAADGVGMTGGDMAGGAGAHGGGAGTEQALERRYRRLLWCYPAGYRRARASEMLDTLLAVAAPGQRWPAGREWRALLLGGLRARTGADRQRSGAEVWKGGVRLGVLFLLVHAAAGMLSETGWAVTGWLGGQPVFGWELGYPVTLLLAAGALVAVAAGRMVPGLVLTVAAAAAQHWAYSSWHDGFGSWPWAIGWAGSMGWSGVTEPPLGTLLMNRTWQLLLAAVLIVPLLRWRPAATARPWWWLVAVPVGVLVLPTTLGSSVPSSSLFLVALAAGLVWCLVDARVPMAAGALMLAYVVPDVEMFVLHVAGRMSAEPSVAVPLVPVALGPIGAFLLADLTTVVVLVAAGAWRVGRQAR